MFVLFVVASCGFAAAAAAARGSEHSNESMDQPVLFFGSKQRFVTLDRMLDFGYYHSRQLTNLQFFCMFFSLSLWKNYMLYG